MRRSATVVIGLLLGAAACSGPTTAPSAQDRPAAWYRTVDAALAEHADVGAMAVVDNGGPCPLADGIQVDGRHLTDVLGHGIERLDGTVPAVLCQWFEGTPVEVTVAHAEDETGYATLEGGAVAEQQPGNEQSQRDVTIGSRTVRVVRTHYTGNPAAGTDFEAFYLDPESRGRVSLRVSQSDDRSSGYDETSVAGDLVHFIEG